MEEKTIDCPLMEEKIEDGICFDISMVAEGMAPIYTAPKKAANKPEFKRICLECPKHKD